MRGTVRKRGTSWQAIVNVTDPETGKRRQLTGTKPTKAEADALLLKLLAQAGRSSAAGSKVTVGELLAAWQEINAETWSPSTVRNTSGLVDAYLLPRFRRTLVRKLRTTDLEAAYVELRREGGRGGAELSAGSVRRVHTIMRSALEQAVRWEWIVDNPARRVDTRKAFIGPARRMAPPAPADVVRLLEAARASDEDFGTWLQVAADTGARRGEVCALRWSDVELEGGTVRLERSIALGKGAPVEKSTKTGNRRRIALAPDTVELLRAHRRRAAARALACGASLPPDAYVFTFDVDGARPWRPDLPTHRFVRLRAELGLETVRLHDLRHFVATMLLGGGVDLTTVAGRLGHAGGGRTTLAVYAHALENADRAAADLLAATRRASS